MSCRPFNRCAHPRGVDDADPARLQRARPDPDETTSRMALIERALRDVLAQW